VLAVTAATGVHDRAVAQSSAASDLVARAAAALGGPERVRAIRTITIEGYGQLAYQNGGGNITSSPDAPQKWIDVTDYSRVIELDPMRTRVRQRQAYGFVFAAAQNMKGVVSTQALDGDVAFNVGATGNATRASSTVARTRRMELLANPVVIVRTALDPATTVTNRRAEGALDLVDVTVPSGDTLTLAVDRVTSLPASVGWTAPDANLGDVVYRTAFTGYQPVSGVLMPTGFNTTLAIDVYRVVANSHMADALMVHVPRDRLLVQGDLFDVSWEVYWWGSSYMDNVRHRKLDVERDVPVHGRIAPLSYVQQSIERQIESAQQLCASVAAAELSLPGCPVKTTVDR
jgi:hypothetical protein